MSDDGFNLRALVRQVLDESSEADPGVLAGIVVGKIDQAQRDAALSQMMRLFVRQVISEARNSHTRSNVTPIGRDKAPTRSAKVAAIRDGWQRRLRDRVHVGQSEWKQLADCTYDDLLAAASERQEYADQNQARAREYRRMADAISEAGVERFADIPTERQMLILGGAA